MSVAHALVIRDGEPQRLLAAQVVVGDILLVEEGDTVAADARVIQSTGLQIAEAPLTGESVAVPKSPATITGDVPLGDRHNMIFAGTSATYGHGRALVVATGMRTEMGRIAGMLRDVPDDTTPLQKELDRVGRSEEHTSELQSPCNLVCRLLLEKKNDEQEQAEQERHHHTP